MPTALNHRPLSLVEFHRLRPKAKESRKKLVRQYPRSVFFIEKIHGGWGIYKGDL